MIYILFIAVTFTYSENRWFSLLLCHILDTIYFFSVYQILLNWAYA